MKAIPRPVILSLIVIATTWVSMARGAEPGSQATGTMDGVDAGRSTLRDTVGYATADPFGPIFHIEGNFGDGLGYDAGYYGGGLMLPHFFDPNSLIFGVVQGAGTEDADAVVNLGLGFRHYLSGWDRIVGLSGWADWDDGHADSYGRGGISFESLGKYFDLRANGYFMFDEDSKEISNFFVGDPFFRRNQIIGLRQIITEIPYDGGEFEVGGPLPFLGRYGVYGHAGAYYLHSKDGGESVGYSTRIDVAATEDISVNVNFTNDDVFGFNSNVSVAWQFPDGRARRWFKPRPVRERLSSQVVRRERIPVRTERDVEPEPLINPDDSEPFFVVHVDPNAGVQGDGTFESPYNTMEAARVANVPSIDIFRIIPREDGSGTNLVMGGNFVLFGTAGTGFVQQRVLGTSVEHTVLAEQGLFDFPGFTGPGPLPLISNGVIAPGGNVFQLANNNEISGIGINARNAGNSASGNGVSNAGPIVDFNLNRNEFTNHINAVSLTNATGVGLFDENTMTGTPGTSVSGLLTLNSAAGTLNLFARDNTSTSHDGDGFSVNATINPAAVVNADFSGNTAELNGNGFFFLAGGGEINLDFNGNTANGNLGTTASSGGFVGSSTGGNLNVDSFTSNDLTNNSGSGAAFLASSGAGGGTITVRNFLANTITNNGSGNTTANQAHGVLLSADGATATVDAEIGGGSPNTITGNGSGTGGGHGIHVATTNDGTVVGAIVGNNISNQPNGFGISVDANTGTVDFGTLPDRLIDGNTIDGNVDAGIGIRVRSDATGRFIITDNVITGTTDGTNTLFDGEGIHVRTEDTAQLDLLTIEGNLIGVTAAGASSPNVGDGVEIELYQNSQAPDINIVLNTIRFNGDAGVRIFRNGDAFIDDVLIDQNVLSDNSDSGLVVDMQGGDINLNGGGPLVIDYTITNNLVQNNGVHGMSLHSTADADLRVIVDNNDISFNAQDGINGQTDFFSQLRGDITNNNISDNGTNSGDHGISLTDLDNGGISYDLNIDNNLIERNFDDGVNFFSFGAGVGTVNLSTNFIRFNGGDGVDANSTFLAVSTINLTDNLIADNAQSGVEMQADDLTLLDTTSSGNVIERNGDDGWSLTTGTGSIATITASLTDNIIRFNEGRGVDIYNQWESFIDVEILGTVDPRPNANVDSSLIDSNGLQGILVQNEADPSRAQNQGLFTGNSIDFRLFQTEVRGNGTNAVADDDGNGLYIRVGTSQFGIVRAAVEDNHFSGNLNIDVVTESFVATIDPPVINPFTDPYNGTVSGFTPDPLARLDFRLQGNVGQQIDVTRVGAFYNNDDEFKSVLGPGPLFDSTTRRRNAQREATNVSAFGSPSSVQDPPAATETTFSSLNNIVTADGQLVNAIVTFTSGANSGQTQQISGTTNDVFDSITVAEAFGAAPADTDTFTITALAQSGTGSSTFRTEDANIFLNNTFDTYITDFNSLLNYPDATADEIAFPFTWTTGLAFGSPFPP